MRRIIAALLITVTAAFVGVTTREASATDPAAEADFVNRINALRSANAASPLAEHSVLVAKARAWADQMAATGCVCHSTLTDGITVSWRKLGENVGRGPNVGSLHQALVNSPSHFANMVDRQFRYIGVGVSYGGGQLYVVEVFMDGDPPPFPPELAQILASTPFGSLDVVSRLPGGVRVGGWAIDPDTSDPVTLHVYVNGVPLAAIAGGNPRPDVGAVYAAAGSNHGFDAIVPSTGGNVCVYAINLGTRGLNPLLGCRVVAGSTPIGSLDAVSRLPGGVRVSGWAIDPDTSDPVTLHVYVNGVPLAAIAGGGSRPDVGAAYPGYGSNHGFDATIPSTGGNVCVYAINRGAGGVNPLVGCRVVAGSTPIGSLDAVSRLPGGVRVSGWAIDPDTSDPVTLHVYVNGVPLAAIAGGGSRPDVGAAYPGYGSNHGFDTTIPSTGGNVCVYAINRGAGGGNPVVGCRIA